MFLFVLDLFGLMVFFAVDGVICWLVFSPLGRKVFEGIFCCSLVAGRNLGEMFFLQDRFRRPKSISDRGFLLSKNKLEALGCYPAENMNFNRAAVCEEGMMVKHG